MLAQRVPVDVAIQQLLLESLELATQASAKNLSVDNAALIAQEAREVVANAVHEIAPDLAESLVFAVVYELGTKCVAGDLAKTTKLIDEVQALHQRYPNNATIALGLANALSEAAAAYDIQGRLAEIRPRLICLEDLQTQFVGHNDIAFHRGLALYICSVSDLRRGEPVDVADVRLTLETLANRFPDDEQFRNLVHGWEHFVSKGGTPPVISV